MLRRLVSKYSKLVLHLHCSALLLSPPSPVDEDIFLLTDHNSPSTSTGTQQTARVSDKLNQSSINSDTGPPPLLISPAHPSRPVTRRYRYQHISSTLHEAGLSIVFKANGTGEYLAILIIDLNLSSNRMKKVVILCMYLQ